MLCVEILQLGVSWLHGFANALQLSFQPLIDHPRGVT